MRIKYHIVPSHQHQFTDLIPSDDVIYRQKNLTNGISIDISAVSHINGEPAVEFLTKFAALQSVGMLEPHADWNELMDSPVQNIQGVSSIFAGSSTFYPGDALSFTFEDPRKEPWETNWWAIYNNLEATGPLTTGGDFYNFFVLGLLPASYFNETITSDSWNVSETDEDEETTNWHEKSFTAFPKTPNIKRPQLGSDGANIITGYFYDDISTSVLSIPHFDQYEEELADFGELLTEFMAGAGNNNLAYVILDLQKNWGGSTASALLLFRELFPGVNPFAGSQRRSHKLANILGSATTQKYQELAAGSQQDKENSLSLISDEWTIVTRLNAETRRNFSSWEEYQGPRRQLEDVMSLVVSCQYSIKGVTSMYQYFVQEQYDLKNPNFHAAAFDGWLLNRYLNDSDAERHVPWMPHNMVIVSSHEVSIFAQAYQTQRLILCSSPTEPAPRPALYLSKLRPRPAPVLSSWAERPNQGPCKPPPAPVALVGILQTI